LPGVSAGAQVSPAQPASFRDAQPCGIEQPQPDAIARLSAGLEQSHHVLLTDDAFRQALFVSWAAPARRPGFDDRYRVRHQNPNRLLMAANVRAREMGDRPDSMSD